MNKDDQNKQQISLVPPEIVEAVALIRQYGIKKYKDPENWRTVEPQRYWEAALRHTLAAWADDKAIDPESGMPHVWHIACNLAFLIALEDGLNPKDIVSDSRSLHPE